MHFKDYKINNNININIPDELSPQENHVLFMMLNGATNKIISKSLFISIKRVNFHISNIFRKLGLKNRAELAGCIIGFDPRECSGEL